MFSKACEYGIRAIIHIAHQSKFKDRTNLKEIAKAIDSPIAFTAKILQALANNNIITSVKGQHGGYEIPQKKQSQITLLQIVQSIDGKNLYSGCGLGLQQCNSRKPCPLHFQFLSIRNDLYQMLKSTTVNELTEGLLEGNVFLKR